MTKSSFIPAMIALGAVAGLGGAAIAQVPQPAMPVNGPVVSLSVTEAVDSAPDMATIGTGIQTRAMTARQAMADNAAQMDKLIAAIVKAGVQRRDVQTSGINLNPQYDYSNRAEGQGPKFLGYEASNQLNVKIRDIKRAGDIVDVMVGAGATNINGPSFGIDDDTALLQQARAKVLKTAGERAAFYAQAAGYRTARLLAISETGEIIRPMPMMARQDMVMAGASTKIEPGQLSTSVTLNLQYVLER